MKLRCARFIDAYLIPILLEEEEGQVVVIVAHGIILSHLWRGILGRFRESNVSVSSDITGVAAGFSLQHLGGWSNTGYLELVVTDAASVISTTSPLKRKLSEGVEVGDVVPAVPDQMSNVVQPVAVADDQTPRSSSPRTPPPTTPTKPLPSSPQEPLSPTTILSSKKLSIKAINSLTHLTGLKKTRGGIGSLKHDDSQKTISSFFKKRKT